MRIPRLAVALMVGLLGCTENPAAPAHPQGGGQGAGGSGGAPQRPADRPPEPVIPRDQMRTPWARMQVGDWAVYHMFQPREKYTRYEVTATTDRTVAFRTQDLDGPQGAPTGRVGTYEVDLMEENRRYVNPHDLVAPTPTFTQDTLNLASGRALACEVAHREHGEQRVENWYYLDAPCFMGEPVVRSIQNGQAVFEVVDFGRASPQGQ